ncbi:MAG: hypothetical protein JO108_05180 [Acidobacteriaceae bacterium]|nr:hypothetical protein [Acidobacteriaceae bacterium]
MGQIKMPNWTGIPLRRMLSSELHTILSLQTQLEERVVGQSHALEIITKRSVIPNISGRVLYATANRSAIQRITVDASEGGGFRFHADQVTEYVGVKCSLTFG